jgi:flagellar biosynthesis protein FliP
MPPEENVDASSPVIVNTPAAPPSQTTNILVSIALAVSGFTMVWMFKSNADQAVRQEQQTVIMERLNAIDDKMEAIETTSQKDLEQDSQMRKFWKIHSWTLYQLNMLHQKNGDPLVTWPDNLTSE